MWPKLANKYTKTRNETCLKNCHFFNFCKHSLDNIGFNIFNNFLIPLFFKSFQVPKKSPISVWLTDWNVSSELVASFTSKVRTTKRFDVHAPTSATSKTSKTSKTKTSKSENRFADLITWPTRTAARWRKLLAASRRTSRSSRRSPAVRQQLQSREESQGSGLGWF